MLTIGDALAAFALRVVKPEFKGPYRKVRLANSARQPDATKWMASVSWTETGAFAARPYATVCLAPAAGFPVERAPREVMRVPDALQGGALCPRSQPQGDEHLKVA